jgi:lysophospholipase
MLVVGLAACRGPDALEPFTDSRIPPGLPLRFYPPQGWAWGLIKIGDAPAVRYGVAAPASRPAGTIIILPDHNETAEAWFQTVRDLNARGYVVWVLERQGLGGSGRSALPRDMPHAKSFDADVAALGVLAARVSHGRPRFLLTFGDSGIIAAHAVELGLPVDGMILVQSGLGAAPSVIAPEDKMINRMASFGFGAFRLPGGGDWRRAQSSERLSVTAEEAERLWVTKLWQTANPDLRMGDPSAGWLHASREAYLTANAGWPRVRTRVLSVGDDACRGPADCRHAPKPELSTSADPHAAFVSLIVDFADPSGAALARRSPTATLDPEG